VRSEVAFWLTTNFKLLGVRIADGPSGETDANKVTFPVSPRLLTVTVALSEVPATKLAELTPVTIEKSGWTVKLKMTDLVSGPLLPAIFTV